MTTDRTLPAPRRTNRNVWVLYAVSVLLLAALYLVWHRAADADRHAAHSDRLAEANQAALATANARLEELGGQPVQPGRRGTQGLSGRGIVASTVVAQHLVLTYTDGTTADVGQVVGPPGPSGQNGDPGKRGASGTPGRAGVDGQDGRGIASTAITGDGHLTVTYTDATTVDLGRVVGPAGAQGEPGPAGFPPASFTFTVPGPGAGNSTTYVCTPDTAAGAGDQPHYACASESDPDPSTTPAVGKASR